MKDKNTSEIVVLGAPKIIKEGIWLNALKKDVDNGIGLIVKTLPTAINNSNLYTWTSTILHIHMNLIT